MVHLIHEISEWDMNKKLSDRFCRHFQVDAYVIVPEYKEHWQFEKNVMIVRRDSNVEKCDVFFYYLLISNIVLLIIVGVFVFGAVRIVYFG